MSLFSLTFRQIRGSSFSVSRTLKGVVRGHICFGALLIILRGALFSILKLTPATSENDPLFEPKSGPSILLRQVVEMRIIRQERGDKTHHQIAEFAVFTRLPGYFEALSRHYIAPSDCAVTNEKSPAYGIDG